MQILMTQSVNTSAKQHCIAGAIQTSFIVSAQEFAHCESQLRLCL